MSAKDVTLSVIIFVTLVFTAFGLYLSVQQHRFGKNNPRCNGDAYFHYRSVDPVPGCQP